MIYKYQSRPFDLCKQLLIIHFTSIYFTSVLFGQRLLSSSPFIEPVRYQEQESKAGTKAGIKLCLSATRVYVYFLPCSERPFMSQMESALEVGKRVPFSTVESSSLAVAL